MIWNEFDHLLNFLCNNNNFHLGFAELKIKVEFLCLRHCRHWQFQIIYKRVDNSLNSLSITFISLNVVIKNVINKKLLLIMLVTQHAAPTIINIFQQQSSQSRINSR